MQPDYIELAEDAASNRKDDQAQAYALIAIAVSLRELANNAKANNERREAEAASFLS